jgi:hypothetical protein
VEFILGYIATYGNLYGEWVVRLFVGLSYGKGTEVFWKSNNGKDSTIYVHFDVETYRQVKADFSKNYSPCIFGVMSLRLDLDISHYGPWSLTAYQSTRRNNAENVTSSAAYLWDYQVLYILILLMRGFRVYFLRNGQWAFGFHTSKYVHE